MNIEYVEKMMSLIDTAKGIYELSKKGMTIELQEKLMQLREEALELQEENLNLKNENLILKEQVESRENLKFKRKVYFRDDDTIPFCPYCFEKSKLLIHLSGPTPSGSVQLYHCQECSIEYWTDGKSDFAIYSGR